MYCAADFVLITGDLVNFPHDKSVQATLRELSGMRRDNHQIPWAYTCGNHDWLLENNETPLSDMRKTQRAKVLWPLFQSRNVSVDCSFHDIKFVTMVVCDNSLWQIDEEQYRYISTQLSRGRPVILGLHIGAALAGSKSKAVLMGDAKFGWNHDPSWMIEKRERWPKSGNMPSTTRFLNNLIHVHGAPGGNLIAILAGHEHISRTDRISQEAMQYITRGGKRRVASLHSSSIYRYGTYVFEGGYRIVRIQDLRHFTRRVSRSTSSSFIGRNATR
eukprot:GEMP01042394.1.p1 GENE.GEMP01042394.1~~GEMP01042394.1.p1  ORF type:complete len:274 (+),score=33.02 GEMP01042394.1:362-1183(+)